MRFEQLVLQMPGAPFELPFHDRLTVISGLDQAERTALVDGVIGALGGAGDEPSELHYIDATGRRAVLRVARGSMTATYDDGEPAICPVGSMVESVERLRALMILDPSDLADTAAPVDDDPPELADAKQRLEELSLCARRGRGTPVPDHRPQERDRRDQVGDPHDRRRHGEVGVLAGARTPRGREGRGRGVRRRRAVDRSGRTARPARPAS